MRDSNSRPLVPETSTLSTELIALCRVLISAFVAKVKKRVEETPPIELFLHPDSVTPGPEIPAAGGTEPDAFHVFIENILWWIGSKD